MSGVFARVPCRHVLLQILIVLLVFGMSSACSATTDSDCNYNEETQECE